MSDDTEEQSYSAFWPVLILLAAFAISYFYQLFEVISERGMVDKQYEQLAPNISKAQAAQDRLVALMKDLVATSAKDPNAARIVAEAKQAGIIRERPAPASTNAAPASP
jgi:hypothetical protein